MSDPDEQRGLRRYTDEEKKKFCDDFLLSGLTNEQFCEQAGISLSSLARWLRRGEAKNPSKKGGPHPPDARRQAVEAFLSSGLTIKDFSRTWGVGAQTISKWIKIYQATGPKGLEETTFKEDPKKRGRESISERLKEEIRKVKVSNLDFGLKKVKDHLARFKGIKVSPGTIRKTLIESEIPLVKVTKKRRRSADKIRYFERAKPMQLWQSDITSYVLARQGKRVYLTVFMDDHSRYIVAWSLELRQTGEFVMEALMNGVQKFGKPEEVLTDQGRQYFTWRGKGEFQKYLDKEGIKHVVSRSHHPETLGKCERFWETVHKEFWSRAKPQDLKDAQVRFEHFVSHYNHFRPHQGLDGMVPADRFFGVENEVRKILEESMQKNAIRLAVDEAPRTPVFLVGQIGDRPLSLHGESGKLVLQTPDGIDEIDYENFGHKRKQIGDNYERNYNNTSSKGEKRSQEVSVDPAEASVAGEGTLELFDSGAEGEGPSGGDRDHGVLDGEDHEDGGGEEAGHSSAEDLAALAVGGLGDARRSAGATEDESERSDDEHGRRPEDSLEENRGAGEDGEDAGQAD